MFILYDNRKSQGGNTEKETSKYCRNAILDPTTNKFSFSKKSKVAGSHTATNNATGENLQNMIEKHDLFLLCYNADKQETGKPW